ncbi:Ferric reduction oxidase 6 [Heracleum sosnowskyi]|uniref:Ferric reduction oxidase 6 n=1 Tax=Heracleum sosnowskyi TaxID=360622 RepID=A0AAD8H3L2_9APIA|nr:Ferric reduction oxidase 6 [Heracleum sosnowskyi]
MDEHSVPLLSDKNENFDYFKKTPFLISSTKWVLKITMWVVFIFWVLVIFLYPTQFLKDWLQTWVDATSGTLFGLTGTIFLLFSGPLLIIAFLGILYLSISKDEEFHEKKTQKKACFRLWTFPVIVDGPFGVVSAAEFIGILLFSVYIIWTLSFYIVQNVAAASSQPTFEEKCIYVLKLTGTRLGSVGLFCLAFLFLPVARGSVLLRLIDIPFEHATRYHVWLGHLTMLIFTLHGLCYVIVWMLHGRLIQKLLAWKDNGIANLPGVISLTAAAAGIFLYMLDRFLRFCQSRKTVDILSARCLPCGTVELVLSKPAGLSYNALSWIFIQIRELSWLQWHPYSVSSSPLDGKHHLAVLIKVLGNWTQKLQQHIVHNSQEGLQKDLLLLPHSNIKASVEGPYGHESPYHLTYSNLILVAGGIGISPYLAILNDILHRISESRLCLPRKILIVWAVKKSTELPLLHSIDMESICPNFSNTLNLEIQTYVTRESEPPLEEGKIHNTVNTSLFHATRKCGISVLAGTGNITWSGIYVVVSTVGLFISVALLDIYYINPFGITYWWYKGLLFLACMVASVLIFGGLVISLWHLWEEDVPGEESEDKKAEIMQHNEPQMDKDPNQKHVSSTFHYGQRPDFKEIFGSMSERWGNVNVGVIVCGPPSLQTSVAKECRAQNIGRGRNNPVFHFNSHSFDL